MDTNPRTQAHPALARLRSARNWLVTGNLVVAGVLAGLLLVWQASLLQAARQHDADMLEALARGLSQTVEAEIARIELGLQSVALQVGPARSDPKAAPPAIDEILAAHLRLMPHVENLRLTDAQGIVRHGSALDPSQRIDLSGQPVFRQARDGARADLTVGEPVRDPAHGRWVLPLALPLHAPDGSFAGVLQADLGARHLEEIFGTVELGAHGAVSLRTSARNLVVRVTEGRASSEGLGTNRISRQLAEALATSPQGGRFVSETAIDGIRRTNVYQAVGRYPLTVLVGHGTAHYEAAWRRQLDPIVLLGGLMLLSMGILSLLVHASIRHELQGRRSLEHRLKQYRQLMHGTGAGVHVLDGRGCVLEADENFAAMLGHRPDFMLGRPLSYWCDLEVEDLGGPVIRTRYRCGDAGVLDVEVSSLRVSDESGVRIFCAARDVTSRRQLESRLLWTDELLDRLSRDAPRGWLVVNPATDEILLVNDRCLDLLDIEPAQRPPAPRTGGAARLLEAMQGRLEPGSRTILARWSQRERGVGAPEQALLKLADGRPILGTCQPIGPGGAEEVALLYLFTEVTQTDAEADGSRPEGRAVPS